MSALGNLAIILSQTLRCPLSAHSYHVSFWPLSHKPLDFGGLQSGTVTTDALGIVLHPSPEHSGL